MRAVLAVGLLAALSACKESDSVVVVNVAIDTNVVPLYSLRVILSSAQTHDTKVYPATASATALPLQASLVIVLPRSRTGVLDLAVDGLDRDSQSVAHGTAETKIVVGGTATVSVNLVAGASLCGNGVIDPGENCDDGNQLSFDGCDFRCQGESPQSDASIPDSAMPDAAKDSLLPQDSAPDIATSDARNNVEVALDVKGPTTDGMTGTGGINTGTGGATGMGGKTGTGGTTSMGGTTGAGGTVGTGGTTLVGTGGTTATVPDAAAVGSGGNGGSDAGLGGAGGADAIAGTGGSSACPSGAVFCDDFESGTLTKWTITAGSNISLATDGTQVMLAQSATTSANTTAAATGVKIVSATVTLRIRVLSAPNTATTACEFELYVRGSPTSGPRLLLTQGRLVFVDDNGKATTGSVRLTPGAWHVLRFVANGTSFSGYLDETLAFGPVTTINLVSGPVGFAVYGVGTAIEIDDFSVTSP